jgi:CubicO group peptidase (beta-lactamase class C family)
MLSVRLASLGIVLGLTAGVATGCGGRSHSVRPTKRAVAEAASTGLKAGLARRLKRAFDRARRDENIPGASAAVILPRCDVWTGVSGVADVRTLVAVDTQTLFAAGSINKTLSAALVVKRAEDGALSLVGPPVVPRVGW